MKIERIFSDNATSSLNNIINSIINEKIDTIIKEKYDKSKVNSTNSSNEEDVA